MLSPTQYSQSLCIVRPAALIQPNITIIVAKLLISFLALLLAICKFQTSRVEFGFKISETSTQLKIALRIEQLTTSAERSHRCSDTPTFASRSRRCPTDQDAA
jgi:hypothetical protein